ncbi:MAG: energy transducer TonB [Bacteroidetes bacterium]|nr:energy transducer TonB [Bacteroidota bacterium]
MSEQLHKNLFNETQCLSEQTLLDYIDNDLSPEQRYHVEKHLVDCELCVDATEGLSLVSNRNIIADTKKLVKATFSADQKKEPKVIRLNFSYKLLAAASVALLICGLFVVNHFLNKNESVVAYKIPAETENNEKQTVQPTSPLNDEKGVETQNKIQPESSTKEALQKTETNRDRLSESEDDNRSDKNKKSISAGETIVPNSAATGSDELNISGADERSAAKSKEAMDEGSGSAETPSPPQTTPEEKSVKSELKQPSGAGNTSLSGDAQKAAQRSAADDAFGDTNKKSRKKDESIVMDKAKDEAKKAAPEPKQEQRQEEMMKRESETRPSKPETTTASPVVDAPYTAPKFPGGETEQQKFINKTIDLKNCPGCKGEVSVSVIVSEKGDLRDPQILKGVSGCECLSEEALRIVKAMPKWEPAKRDGGAVSTKHSLSIKFE